MKSAYGDYSYYNKIDCNTYTSTVNENQAITMWLGFSHESSAKMSVIGHHKAIIGILFLSIIIYLVLYLWYHNEK